MLDWPHSVADKDSGLYAHTIQAAYDEHLSTLPPLPSTSDIATRRCVKGIDGMEDGFTDNAKERKKQITILCGSTQRYEPYGHDDHQEGNETVMVFPDYKVRFARRFHSM